MTRIESPIATHETTAKKEYPWYAVPAILSMLMLSSGGMFVLIAHGISTLSSVGY